MNFISRCVFSLKIPYREIIEVVFQHCRFYIKVLNSMVARHPAFQVTFCFVWLKVGVDYVMENDFALIQKQCRSAERAFYECFILLNSNISSTLSTFYLHDMSMNPE